MSEGLVDDAKISSDELKAPGLKIPVLLAIATHLAMKGSYKEARETFAKAREIVRIVLDCDKPLMRHKIVVAQAEAGFFAEAKITLNEMRNIAEKTDALYEMASIDTIVSPDSPISKALFRAAAGKTIIVSANTFSIVD